MFFESVYIWLFLRFVQKREKFFHINFFRRTLAAPRQTIVGTFYVQLLEDPRQYFLAKQQPK